VTVSRRILVIEDDEALGRAMRRILKSVFEVTKCSTDSAARLLLLSEAFDVVVSDVQLGEESGLDLFKEVVTQHPELVARYVFISGDADEPKTRAGLASTGAPFLQKPFRVYELTEGIAWVLAQRYAAEARKK
jgi:DNA-binding NtrC family response regulator